jgi:hypothetical protein
VKPGPTLDIREIQRLALDRKNVPNVVPVLVSIPTQLLDDHILGSGDPRFAIDVGKELPNSSGESLPIVWIRTEVKEFNGEMSARDAYYLAPGADDRLERDLGIDLQTRW